jgi:hypothetical protein
MTKERGVTPKAPADDALSAGRSLRGLKAFALCRFADQDSVLRGPELLELVCELAEHLGASRCDLAENIARIFSSRTFEFAGRSAIRFGTPVFERRNPPNYSGIAMNLLLKERIDGIPSGQINGPEVSVHE